MQTWGLRGTRGGLNPHKSSTVSDISYEHWTYHKPYNLQLLELCRGPLDKYAVKINNYTKLNYLGKPREHPVCFESYIFRYNAESEQLIERFLRQLFNPYLKLVLSYVTCKQHKTMRTDQHCLPAHPLDKRGALTQIGWCGLLDDIRKYFWMFPSSQACVQTIWIHLIIKFCIVSTI